MIALLWVSLPEYAGPSPLSLIVVGGILVGLGWAFRRAMAEDELLARDLDDAALLRSIHDGTYRVPPEKAARVMREIFQRTPDDAASLSTKADVARLRAWRERRAVTSINHTTRHHAEGFNESEWAREVLAFCVSDRETMEDGTE